MVGISVGLWLVEVRCRKLRVAAGVASAVELIVVKSVLCCGEGSIHILLPVEPAALRLREECGGWKKRGNAGESEGARGKVGLFIVLAHSAVGT